MMLATIVLLCVLVSAFAEVEYSHRVFLDIFVNGQDFGRVLIGLYSHVPLAKDNFRALCTGENGIGHFGEKLSYTGSSIFYVNYDGIGGGDIVTQTGAGSDSIYSEPQFSPDPLSFSIPHNAPYQLSLIGNDDGTLGSRFFISFGETRPESDGIDPVIGDVIQGQDILKIVREFFVGDTESVLTFGASGEITE